MGILPAMARLVEAGRAQNVRHGSFGPSITAQPSIGSFMRKRATLVSAIEDGLRVALVDGIARARRHPGEKPVAAMRLAHKRKASMKRLIMMLLLVALAIPATAFAAAFGSSGHGTCTFTTNDKTKTMALVADCTTDTTIGVPDGYTLDGKGLTITAVDGPTGTAFDGAVVQNDGTAMNVKNLKIEGGVAEQLRRRLQRRRLHGRERLDQGRHAQQHRADDRLSVRARDPRRQRSRYDHGSPSRSRATSSRPTTRTGSTCAATSTRRSSGTPSRARAERPTSPRTASSSTGPIRSRRSGATRSAGTTYTGPADTDATGILVIDANVNIDRKNTLSGNEVDIDNDAAPSAASSAPNNKGRGVATPTPDSPARQLMHRKARSRGPLSRSCRRGSVTLP